MPAATPDGRSRAGFALAFGYSFVIMRYSEYEASIRIDDGEMLTGELPRKQLRLVQAWIELHRDELMANWDLAVAGETPYKIDPL